MSFPFTPGGDATSISTTILLDALRCWRSARNAGHPAQPALYAALSPEGLGMLAPVFDGLLTAIEAAQGGPYAQILNNDSWPDSDERFLLELFGGAAAGNIGSPPIADILHVAARSVVIMIGLEGVEEEGPSNRGYHPLVLDACDPQHETLSPAASAEGEARAPAMLPQLQPSPPVV